MFTSNRKKQIEQAKKNFRNHKATFKQFDGISTLDWRNKDGSSNYYIRYVFDEEKGCLYITGDLGSAVVRLTEKSMLESLSSYINSIGYFLGKILCSTDKYVYDLELARDQLKQRLIIPDEEYEDERLDELQVLVSDTLECFEELNGFNLSDDVKERLSKEDADYWEWIYDIGKDVDIRVILWLVGLEMAYNQICKKNNNKSCLM